MTAHIACGPAAVASLADRSIDELDLEIRRLARQMNAETYRMLTLVRDFDDRFGWAKWGLRNCAEWLAWRCGLSLSAAREKVRTAQALRSLPVISAAFADGRLSYSKVRALTRVAHESDEDLLLAYALEATASQVEERCRQIRNAGPESVEGARHVWERRTLALFRDRARGVVRITVELPECDGELVGRALESAVAAGDAAFGVEFASNPERSVDGWRAQQADALVAIAKAYLGGGANAANGAAAIDGSARCDSPASRSVSAADHYQVVVHVDEKSLRGGAGRSDLPSAAHHSTSAASSAPCRQRSSARSGRAIVAARSQAATTRATSTRTTSSIGRMAVRPAPITSRCSARITTRCCTRAALRSIATPATESTSGGRTGA